METSLVYLDGMELPAFASFPLLDSDSGRQRLRDWYRDFLDIAARHGAGFILEAPVWRANADWGAVLGYDSDALDRVNRESIEFMRELAAESGLKDIIISAGIGPRGDGYAVENAMSAAEATEYHRPQVCSIAAGRADMFSALTINYAEEAIGIAQNAADLGVPVVISFTLETDGLLPSGESLGDAIERVDAAVPGAVAFYMINCAHPTHFEDALESGAPWLSRLRGLRANASTRSHAELDISTELDRGRSRRSGHPLCGHPCAGSRDVGPGRLLRHRPCARRSYRVGGREQHAPGRLNGGAPSIRRIRSGSLA